MDFDPNDSNIDSIYSGKCVFVLTLVHKIIYNIWWQTFSLFFWNMWPFELQKIGKCDSKRG